MSILTPRPAKAEQPFVLDETSLSIEVRPPLSPIVLNSNDKVNGDRIRQQSQELSTVVYLYEGFIQPEALNDQGLYVDKYANRSVYFFAENSIRHSTCRYIQADKKEGGILSLPTAKHFSVDADAVRHAAGVDRLTQIKSRDVIEVSALASVRVGEQQTLDGEMDTTRLMYATILRESLDSGHKLWMMNTHEKLVRRLEIMLGKEQVHRLGEVMFYKGSPTIPVAINPQRVVETAFEDTTRIGDMKREYLKETLQGVNDRHLSKRLIELFDEHGIEHQEASALSKLGKHKKALAYAGITGYAISRGIPVAAVEEFEGSPAAFVAIDVATAFPYTWGLIEVASAKKPSRKVLGGTVAAGSFVAPYAYFFAEGEGYPMWVNGVAAGIIGVAGLTAVRGVMKDRQIEQALAHASPETED